jgi:hypothetical protein
MIVFFVSEVGVPLCFSVQKFSGIVIGLACLQFSVFARAQDAEEESPADRSEQRQVKEASKPKSAVFPDWVPRKNEYGINPVLGFQYLSIPKSLGSPFQSDATVMQAEIGGYAEVRGVPLIPDNPGLQLEPAFGYAVGQAFAKESGKSIESGSYSRTWGGLAAPIYYRFFRQTFGGKYGLVTGGPLPAVRHSVLMSDSGFKILSFLSAHYTLTYERTFGEKATSPEVKVRDNWLHGRLSAPVLSFFFDMGPGFSTVESSVADASAKRINGRTSSAYLLALSGLDLVPNKIGFEASGKYMFSSDTDANFATPSGRSPLMDLGAQAASTGLPADSLSVSAFCGVRRLFGPFGFGWRYSLEILNYSESEEKQQKRESSGLGIVGTFSF